MFHISFLIRDKHLADTLRFLGQKAMNLEVRPAQAESDEPTSATSKPTRIKGSTSQKSQQMREIVAQALDEQGEFQLKDLVAKGFSTGGAWGFLDKLVKSGDLVREKRGKINYYRAPRQSDRLPNYSSTSGAASEGVLSNAS